LGEQFGELVRDGADQARPEITPVRSKAGANRDQGGTRWHTDGCYSAVPPTFSILRAIDVKPFGGDTCFSSAVAAYAGLSDEMKARIAPLRYTAELAYVLRRNASKTQGFGRDEKWRELEKKYPMITQPVVRVHPETGAPVLFVNDGYSIDIVGMEGPEGRALLRTLNDEFNRPEYQVRWSWENDSVAMWDNRAVQHYGVPDPQYDRYLERVTVVGAPSIGLEEWNRDHREAVAAV
jgi:taurine dioxygenase